MRNDLDQTANDYSRDNQAEYRKWLNNETSRLLSTPQFMLTGASTFIVLTLVNYFQVYGARCLPAYAGSIVLFFSYRMLREVFGHRIDKFSAYYMDAIALSSLAGVFYMVYLAKEMGHVLINAPVQAAIVVLTILSYHPNAVHNLLRNIGLSILSAIGLYLVNQDYFQKAIIQIPTGLFPGLYVNHYVLRSLRLRFYHNRSNSQARAHAFNQLSSAFYPHQVERMETGENLTDTMPVGQSNAYVICFDIVNSSKVMHENFHEVRDRIFGRCYQVMLENYQHNPLTANAHRIKDLGDGFLCSVGYPFAIPSGRRGAELALELAQRFISIFDEEILRMEYIQPIYCSIGIAYGVVEAFYPNAGLKLYDLRDSAIVLANRYESLRKVIFPSLPNNTYGRATGNIITIQEKVFVNLPASYRQSFNEWDASVRERAVRDDPEAKRAYYQILEPGETARLTEKTASGAA